jgi:hypothetical protein
MQNLSKLANPFELNENSMFHPNNLNMAAKAGSQNVYNGFLAQENPNNGQGNFFNSNNQGQQNFF